MIDVKRIKLQTNPPGSARPVKVRQSPPLDLGARRPVVLRPVEYNAATGPGQSSSEMEAALGQLSQLAHALGMQVTPAPSKGGRPTTSPASSTSGRPATSPASSPPPSTDVRMEGPFPDPAVQQADAFVETMLAMTEEAAAYLPPERQAELTQVRDFLARLFHNAPGK